MDDYHNDNGDTSTQIQKINDSLESFLKDDNSSSHCTAQPVFCKDDFDLSIIIITSPSGVHPSTLLIDSVIESVSRAILGDTSDIKNDNAPPHVK